MRFRQPTLSPLLRTLSVLMLAVFVVAQAACSVHCNFGGGHGDKAQPSCHASSQHVASNTSDSDSTPSIPSPTSICSTLKTMLVGGDAPTLIASQLHTLHPFAPMTLSLDASEVQRKASFYRQVWTREWVFTPEVCLGPAFRSLAPPLIG